MHDANYFDGVSSLVHAINDDVVTFSDDSKVTFQIIAPLPYSGLPLKHRNF